MIYTSYYGNLYRLNRLCTVSISRTDPKGVKVRQRLEWLQPSKELLNMWHREHNENAYIDAYLKNLIEREKMFQQMTILADCMRKYRGDIVLLCWEKSGFCHRHLVADYFKWKYDLNIIEYK